MTTQALPRRALEAFESASDAQLIAALELVYMVAKADGFVAADELRQLLGIARAVGQERIDTHRLSDLISEFRDRATEPPEARIGALGDILETSELKRMAYDLAASTVTIDRELSDKELETINLIGDVLGLT